jgi:hypothetical protein
MPNICLMRTALFKQTSKPTSARNKQHKGCHRITAARPVGSADLPGSTVVQGTHTNVVLAEIKSSFIQYSGYDTHV